MSSSSPDNDIGVKGISFLAQLVLKFENPLTNKDTVYQFKGQLVKCLTCEK